MPSHYSNESFLQSLQASRGDITRQVGNAINEINRQRQFNLGQTALLPGRFGQVFAPAAQGYQDQVRALTGSIQNAGITPLMSAEALSAPSLGALAQQRSIFEGTVPLLEAGFGELAQRQTGSAQNLGAQLQSGLDVEARNYIAGRETEDRAATRALESETRAAERDQARFVAQQQFEVSQTNAARQFQAQQDAAARQFQAEQAALSRQFQGSEADRDRQIQVQQFAARQAEDARQFNAAQSQQASQFRASQASSGDGLSFSEKEAIKSGNAFNLYRAKTEYDQQISSQPQYKLSDFGQSEINPLRGQALIAQAPTRVAVMRALIRLM